MNKSTTFPLTLLLGKLGLMLGRTKWMTLPLLISMLLGMEKVAAQTNVTFDREYWLALPTTDVKYRPGSMFHISTFDQPASVTLSAPLVSGFVPKTINIAANSVGSIPLTDAEVALLINNVGNSVGGTGVHVQTNAKISIYYEPGSLQQSPDLLPLKGGEALGTEFLVPMQQTSPVRDPDGRQGFLVLATEDNTNVTITPKAAITGRAAGVPFTITLHRGQTYFAETPGLGPATSGSLVTSDKLIAITIFSELMRYGAGAADLGSEQIVPIKNIGTEYLIVRGYRATTDVVYFTAVEDGTQITVNGSVVANLNATQTYALNTGATNAYHVVSSKKVTALQLSGVTDEESFSLLPSQLGCNGSNIVKVVRANNTAFYVNIASPTNTGFSVNGNTTLLAPAAFQPIPGSTWYYARVEVPSTLVGAGAAVIVSNNDPSIRFHMGVFHTNNGGARYGYFSSYSGTLINFAEAKKEACVGQSVSFIPQIVSSDPIVSYTWIGPDGNVVSSEEVLTLDNLTTDNNGTYRLRIETVVCAIEESVQLTVHQVPNVPISGGDQEVRATNPIQTLTASATLPADAPTGASIIWYDAPTGGNVVASPTLNAIGSVTYYAETNISGVCPSASRTPVKLTILSDVEICGNGIDDDGNGLADCDDPACNPYVNYFANGSLEDYTQCPNLSAAGTLAYALSWKTSQPAPTQTGGQLLVNDPTKGCVSPRPAASWLASTNLPAGSDGVAWGGMHGGAPNQGLEDFQNTLIAPLPAGTYTFTFSAGYLVNDPYTAPGYFKFYGVKPGEADFSTAHPLGDSPLINNAISSTNPTWKEYSFSFTSTETYDRIYMVAYSGPAGRSYLVFDGFKMVYNPPTIGFQNPLATCLPDAVIEVKNPDPAWVSYQWYMDGELLAGATGVSYQPTTGQMGVFTVSGVLASGCASAPSAGITLGSNCPIPFECNGSAYLVSTTGGTVPSILSIVDAGNPNTVHATITPSIADQYNGIGFNFEDNLIYGYAVGTVPSLTAGDIVQFDAKGTVRRLGAPTPVPGQAPGLPRWTTNAAVNANGGIVNLAPGVVGLNNKFYGMVTTNVATNRYLVTVDLTTMTYTTVKLSGNYVPADLAFSPYDGMLYGLAGNVLIRTNPNNGNQQAVTPTSGTLPANVGAGGAWNDVLGRVYFFTNSGSPANGAERLYRYNPANGAFVNVVAVTPYPGFDATACFPTRLEKKILMPTEGLKPGDVVEFEFSIYNSQMLPMTYEFEDILTSTDLSWVPNTVNPATPGGGTVSVNGNTLRISGITVPPAPASGGEPLRFRVSLKVADNAAYGTCYTNQATIKVGGITVLSDNPETSENNDPTAFCLNPCDLPAPISGGNLQACLADLNGGKLTASATVPAGVNLVWYDAPVGGNVVTDPSLSAVGTVTYYATADDGVCTSVARTPVTLNIVASPVLAEISNVTNCGPYELPAIEGEHLTGNEAYYTGTGGTGTKYMPGEVISALGTSTLYVYDATEAKENCAGALSVTNNTKLTQADMGGAYLYSVDNTNFWNGTAGTTINYNATDPAWNGQTYKTIAGDINISGATECFGTQVQITAKVTVVNNGPGAGNAYSGQFGIWNNETNQTLYLTQLRSTPVGRAIDLTVTGVVPLADLAAGKLSIIVSLETLHSTVKNWTVSNFEANYQFIPANTQVCSAERSFELTINEAPAAPTSGGNQQACISDITDKLTATATAPDGTQLIWYDAPVGGNVVTDPSLDTVGTITYFAAADNGTCTSTTRTPVTLSITASPVLDEIEDVAVCEVFTLPEIIGTGLSGNQAYYTEPNAGGIKYLPGDQLTTVGTTTLYVYDESGRVENCAGSLSVVANTGYPKVDFDQMVNQNTVMQYPRAINPAFWSGTGTQTINYSAADPIVDGQTYPAIIGKVNIGDTDNCFGTDVFISADVTVTNDGPTNGFGGIGYFSIINTATNTRLFNGGFPTSPAAGSTFQGHVEGVVPVADVLAGNISIMIVVETYHVGAKNWTLSNFKSAYKFLPEVAQNCFDEKSFEVTINEPPVLVITDPAAVCLPGTVDITASAVTQGSTAGLTYTYFTDSLATSPLANPEAIAVSGTYYIMGTNPATGCSSIAPVEVVLIARPELRVGQPSCLNGEGSIEVLSPLGTEFEYSIDGATYQANPLFGAVAAGTYQVTARNTVTNCVSLATEVTIDEAPQAPTPEVTQPDCSVTTGTIILPRYNGASYSINGGPFVSSNVFTDLAPGNYQLVVRDADGCDSDPVSVTINEAPLPPAAPTSGGNQIACAENPVQTLTATATVRSGEMLVWYDAPVGGNVVNNPILNAIGTITYYAEATNGSCSSPTRTPVTLMIQSAPHIEPIENQEACETYVLPEITGVNLTGNEAYYTVPGGGGQKYVAGDSITTLGTTNLYIYDRAEGQTNCAGSLSVVKTTKVSQADIEAIFSFVPHYLTNTYDQGLWEGVPTVINYDATDPQAISQTYKTVVGDVVLTGSPACFGSAVQINPKVRITNNGPDNGRGYAGRVSIINNATNTEINYALLTETPVGSPVDIDIIGVVPVSDLVAGNISIVISVETYHTDNYIKDWTISDFSADYQFIPESTESCFDEESFSVTIYEKPIADAGADETLYNGGVFTLNATTPTVGTGEWSVVSGTPAVGIVDVTNPNAAITLDPNTSVTLRWTVTNGTCVAFDDVVLSYVSQADINTVKVTSEAGKTEFTPGESVDYTITVTNNGPSDATAVNVKDTAPAGTTITNWTAVVTTGTVTLPNTSGSGDINETIPTLPNGAVVTYTVTVQTPSDFSGELVNAVEVTTPTEDPDPSCTQCTTPPLDPAPKADIVTVKVTSEAGKTEFTPGESVDYTITVTNNGPSDATAVNVKDTAPAGTTITGWTAVVTNGTVTLPNTSGTGDINETIATLPNGAVVTYTVTVRTPSDFTGELVNAVEVTTPTEDPDPSCTQCTTPPLDPAPKADIVTVKVVSEAGKTTYTPGESVDYTITVTNNGPSDATAVNVKDTAPAGTTITGWTAVVTNGTVTLPNTSGSGDINETIATLPNGAVVTYTVTVRTPSDFTGELVNAVEVTTPTEDPDPSCTQCTTPPLDPAPKADIVTVKVTSEAGKTEFTPGESVDYTITVTNNGPSDATAVNVKDTAPAGTTITNWTAVVTNGTVTLPNTSGTGDINETIGTLPNGAVVTYTVTVLTPSDFTGELVNAVEVTTPTEDPDPSCTQCTTPPLDPAPKADIVTVKVVSEAGKTTYTPGESVDYTITVTNNGPSDATAVNVKDTAPAGTTITNWTAVVTNGTVTLPNTSGSGDINETIPTLPNGAVVTYTVTVLTPSDFTGELVNAVEVTTPTEDPDPSCTQCTTPPLDPAPKADIVTVKVVSEAGKTTYTPGESVDYTITVTNNGPSDATAVNVKDTAPAGTTISNWTAVVTTGTVTLPNTSGSGDINETIATLPNGAVVTYTVTVQTPSDFTGELVNAVEVTTPTEDPDPSCTQCTTPPLDPAPKADIVTVKVTSEAGKTEFTPGESVDYTITVTNNGPSDATAVNVKDTAPAGTTISNWTAVVTNGTVTLPNTSGTGDINETIATLPNGAVVTYTVTVQTPSDFTG
ncbi:hypothetical protein, partial [Olivibacter jilunii]|uniref:Ig-like domain-containing protein n=1 Tax=Olivibacter jilunii TaxID=985016 RepID=UPI003F17436E